MSSSVACKKVLVLAAHPDDETLGCGATIARLAQEGAYIKLITFTDGESARGPTLQNRNTKLKKVCQKLGIADFAFATFPDNELDTISLLDLCKYIESSVNFDPDIIFTHHPDCLNIDHSQVYRATMTVFRPQKGKSLDIMAYHIPSSTNYNPYNRFNGNVYYDVGATYDLKLSCLQENYSEEMRPPPHSRSYENIFNTMKVCGADIGVEYAEKFELIRRIK